MSDGLLDAAFPDHRRLLPAARTPVPVHAGGLRSAIAAGGVRRVPRGPDGSDVDVTVLSADPAGRPVVGAGTEGVAVNVEFLLEAVDAGGAGQLVLALDGPLAPVAIRGGAGYSLLMPVRLRPAGDSCACAHGVLHTRETVRAWVRNRARRR